jgi:hypothetical protein
MRPVLIIHNQKRKDRLEILLQELAEQHITVFHFFPSIHTEQRPCSNISKAHKECVKWAKENGHPEVIIMEDDVMFLHDNAFKWFNDAISWLKAWNPTFPILTGGNYDGFVTSVGNGVAEIREFSGLHCYCINESFYDTFLQADERVNIDKWVSGKDFNNQTCYCLYPFQIMQYDGFSDNVKRDTQYNKKLAGRFEIWPSHKFQ